MKKITNKIIFIIITCASIISVASLTKTNAQEINRNDLTAYKTDMSSIENETPIRTASSSEKTTWDVSENGDGSVIATIEGIQGGMYVHMKISGTGRISDFYNNMQKDCSLIVISVRIESGITGIGDNAFSGCSFRDISIPNSVTSIGDNAFLNCSSELTITTPCNNEYVINYAKTNNIQTNISHKYKYDSVDIDNKIVTYKCENCEETKTETFTESWDVSENQDNSVIAVLTTDGTLIISGSGRMKDYDSDTYLPYYNKKESIKKAIIEEGVESIGENAFGNCNSLTNITIPSSVTNIGACAFQMCKSLTSIIIPKGVTDIKIGTFNGCDSLISVTIPESVTNIQMLAFGNCNNLSNITISKSVTNIEDFAIINCDQLQNIEVDNNNPNYCSDEGVLFNKEKTQLMVYPAKKEDKEYIVPRSVTKISDNAFKTCSGLTNITIPGSVTSIGDSTFSHCSNLTSVILKEGIIDIQNHAFGYCDKLNNITIPNSVTSIGENAFYNHSSELTINTPCNSEYVISYAEENSITTELIHNWGEWKITKEPTFTEEGTKTRTCANDETHKETETIAKLDKSLLEKHEAKAATCEEAGNNGYYSYNGKYYSDSEGTQEIQENSWVIEALGHAYGESTYTWNEDKTECTAERVCTRDASHKETETAKTTNSVTKESTCEQAGERTYTATFTNTAFAEQTTTEEIKATGHTAGTPVEENRVESTCTQEGHYDEVIYCTVCNKEISRIQKTIEKKEHTYSTEWTIDKEATCEETGEKSHHCTECGERTDITTIEALGHDYQIKSTTDAVCEKGGTIIYECTRCKATKQETIPPTGHREEIDAAVEPTCTEKGKTEGKHCSVCGKVLVAQEEIPAKGHTAGTPVEENRVEATCTEEGHYDEVIYCTVCNKEISRETKTIKAKEHTYSTEWTIDKEATCEETGEKSHHCTECGERTDITTIEALGHDYQIKSTTEAVCEKGGTIIYECTRCKATKQETIPATGHREEIDAAVEPTCTEKGKTEGKHCSVCGKVLVAQEEIPAKGHTAGTPVEENRVEATCTEEGHYDEVIYCTVCNKEISRETKTIKAKEHTYSTEWTIDKEATCEETGEKSHHCTECGERTDITTIEALGHDYQIKSTTEAVCEKGGTIIYECTRCKTTKEETTPALGHKGGTPVEENRVEATCTENGSYDEVTYCKVCGEKLLKEKKTIPALGHDYEEIVVQPTETEQGYTLHICKRCKDEYKDNYVPSIDKKDPIQIKDNEKDITIIEKEEQKYIIVEPNTTVDRLKEAIIIEKEYTVIDKENKQKEGILATGDKITVKDTYKTSYIIIVKGDVNEDGVIDFMGDVVMLNNYRLGLIKLSKEAILAGDMNMDGKIDFVEDVVKINNYRISAVRSLIK